MSFTYSDYQDWPVSEKTGLVRMNAKLRLMGWEVYLGSVYQYTDFDFSVIVALEDSGVAYIAVSDVASVAAGKYYNDRVNKILYLQASDSSNPNSRFLVVTFKQFFSNQPQLLPWDLATGYDVYWEPLLRETSNFSAELDNQEQLGFAIEGMGRIALINDIDYWQDRYEIYSFDNQSVDVYSWNNNLPISEAKKIYDGKVQKKSMSNTNIVFTVKDFLNVLRTDIPLSTMESVSGARIEESENDFLQRRIYGRVHGHLPMNIDQVIEGYPITGTVSVTLSGTTITGSSTEFLKEFRADDVIKIVSAEYTIKSVDSDTSMTITDIIVVTKVGVIAEIIPSKPKRYINRVWFLCGHATKQPATTITDIRNFRRLTLADNENFLDGDDIYVGSAPGEVAFVNEVRSDGVITLTQSLDKYYPPGTAVFRPSVQDVKINKTKLEYYRDYTYDPATAKLTLDDLAEFNIAPTLSVVGTCKFTNGSRTVTGTSTIFLSQFQPGDWIKPFAGGDWMEVLRIESTSTIIVATAWGEATTASVASIYKPVTVFDVEEDVLTLDTFGITEDETATGDFMLSGSEIISDILDETDLSGNIDTTSFDEAHAMAPYHLGLVIPALIEATDTTIYRDVIDQINKSIFGSIFENDQFEISYKILNPKRPTDTIKFQESDIIKMITKKNNDLVAKTAQLSYQHREYDTQTKEESFKYQQSTSTYATYVTQTDRIRTIATLLADPDDAEILASRWAFILELGSTTINITTKIQGQQFEINDLLDISHEKFYSSLGVSTRKIGIVQAVKKGVHEVRIEVEDLSNAFSRCGTITADDANEYDVATQDDKLYLGYITDDYGIINNDRLTFGRHVIW